MTTHTGQGFAIPKGDTYTAPDQAELNRRAAQREADAKQARRDALTELEEFERRTMALAAGIQAAVRTYRLLGGRKTLPSLGWGPEPDPTEDVFAGVDGNGEVRNGN